VCRSGSAERGVRWARGAVRVAVGVLVGVSVTVGVGRRVTANSIPGAGCDQVLGRYL